MEPIDADVDLVLVIRTRWPHERALARVCGMVDAHPQRIVIVNLSPTANAKHFLPPVLCFTVPNVNGRDNQMVSVLWIIAELHDCIVSQWLAEGNRVARTSALSVWSDAHRRG